MAPTVDPKAARDSMRDALGTTKFKDTESQDHAFWHNQPVPRFGSRIDTDEHVAIDEPKTVDDIPAEPYALKGAYEWSEIDVHDPKEMQDVYKLLYSNYVEDGDCMFRFDYSVEFLFWALTPPHYLKEWHLGVRVASGATKTLVGFISAIPAAMRAYNHVMPMVEINFLCVHKQLRTKRLAPLLIKEITRRVNRRNIWQAVYTAGIVLPNPVVATQYYHRSLNPKKLIEIGFSGLPRHAKVSTMQKLYKLPDAPTIPGLREMTPADVPSAYRLLFEHLKKFHVALVLSEEEFAHWQLSRQNVVHSYVVATAEGNVTDLLSFYTIPSTVIGNNKHKTLIAAYCYYNVATTVSYGQLLHNSLILAKKCGHDVFNALDIMDNEAEFKALKFGTGDGRLSYYFYNWKCPLTTPKNLGLVLL